MRSTTAIAISPGPLDCNPNSAAATRRLPGSCVQFVDLYKAQGGKWITQNPIDLRTR